MIGEGMSKDMVFARHYIGEDAKPTGQMRMLGNDGMARLQCRWVGSLGELWVDVPTVEVDVMPLHQFEP